jgi:hypothetical protein
MRRRQFLKLGAAAVVAPQMLAEVVKAAPQIARDWKVKHTFNTGIAGAGHWENATGTSIGTINAKMLQDHFHAFFDEYNQSQMDMIYVPITSLEP